MRFVAGRGTVAELLARGAAVAEMLQAGALQRRAIGKQARKEPLLPARKEPQLQARKEPQLQAGKEHPVLQANKKESGKTHSLLSPL